MDRARTWARVGVLALLWGSTFLWIEVALEALTPVQVTIGRCLVGSAALLVACRVSGRRLPRWRVVWCHLAVAALFCNALPFALFSFGQRGIDSGLAGVLNATTPLWSLLIGLTALTLPAGGLTAIHAGPWTVIVVLILGIVSTAASFHLAYRIIAAEGATNAATVGYLLPVVSVALGAIVLGEPPQRPDPRGDGGGARRRGPDPVRGAGEGPRPISSWVSESRGGRRVTC